MNCKNCKHWNIPDNLRDYRDIADCQYVIGAIQPKILSCLDLNSNPLTLPFDPNETQNFQFNSVFRKQIREAVEKCSKFGPIYNEKEKRKRFFRTHKNFLCQYFEENLCT